jgi:ribonucleoside-diphosphate reductase alpha chain
MQTIVPPVAEQDISRDTLREKYAKGKEASAPDALRLVRQRVARALEQAEPEEKRAYWERRFLQAQEDGFIPAGRINSAAGVQLQATLINCFVQPVGDSISEIVDGKPGIYTALQEAAETMRRGGGVDQQGFEARCGAVGIEGTIERDAQGLRHHGVQEQLVVRPYHRLGRIAVGCAHQRQANKPQRHEPQR